MCRIWKIECLSWKHCKKHFRKEQVCLTSTVVKHNVLFEFIEKALSISVPCVSAEAYDKLQTNIVKARERLTKILTSKDIKATVCSYTFASVSIQML